jgi:hypothetical protein
MSGSIGGAGGHHINSAEIMAWVAQHSGEMGALVNDSMMEAKDRVDQLKDLSKIKTSLTAAKANCDFGSVASQMDAFLKANEGAPNFEDLKQQVGAIKDALSFAQGQIKALKDDTGMDLLAQKTATEAIEQGVVPHISEWIATIDGVSEGIKKDDQMGMLSLQEATSQLNQSFQQASNVMQSLHSAAMAVLGNIRA